MKFLLPQGIGDSVWALHKIQSAAARMEADKIEVYLNYSHPINEVQCRALDFVKRFSFVHSSDMLAIMIHDYGCSIDKEGHYVYINDGWLDYNGERYFAMMPNGPLERGIRLENWLPQFEINWKASDCFQFDKEDVDYADALHKKIGRYCVFYLGPFRGNMFEGHNRGSIWTPADWSVLGYYIQKELGSRIVVVGADYDMDYWVNMMEPTLDLSDQGNWVNLIGDLPISKTYAVIKRSDFVISYQSGIGIFSSYLGVPTGIFWRAKGDTISPDTFISFEEEMASAWTRPDMIASGKHLPLIYGRHDPGYIISEIHKRGW